MNVVKVFPEIIPSPITVETLKAFNQAGDNVWVRRSSDPVLLLIDNAMRYGTGVMKEGRVIDHGEFMKRPKNNG